MEDGGAAFKAAHFAKNSISMVFDVGAGAKRPASEGSSDPEQAKRVKLQDGGVGVFENGPSAATLASQVEEGIALPTNACCVLSCRQCILQCIFRDCNTFGVSDADV